MLRAGSHSVSILSHDNAYVNALRALTRNAHASLDDREDFLDFVPVGASELDRPGLGDVGFAAEAGAGPAVARSVLLGGGAPVQLEVLRLFRAPGLLALFQAFLLMRQRSAAGAYLTISHNFSQVALSVPAVYSFAETDTALLRAISPLCVLSDALVVVQRQLCSFLFRVTC